MMEVERYSHVMQHRSDVQGELRPNKDAFDVFRACFPAGTVFGRPKSARHGDHRRARAGASRAVCRAVGYFGFSGNMDTCIAIRTMVMKGDRVYLQAGAGLVAIRTPPANTKRPRTAEGAVAGAVAGRARPGFN
jgi:anthranilate synthase component 1